MVIITINYRITGKFDESSVSCQTKTIQISTYTINNLLTDLLIRQTFFHQRLKKSQFAKLSSYTVFLPTLLQKLDTLLQGGIPAGCITEVSGYKISNPLWY